MRVGWCKFHRQIFDNPICTKDAEHFFVWCYLLTEAHHEDGERALFQSRDLELSYCTFADGESPLKESKNLKIENCFILKNLIW